MESNILKELNAEQREAVTSTEGYVRVIAGAGSGKTKALTSRYVYIVKELGISTANILCVTFTNKAAREMKKRIRAMIGDNDTALICTFHGFCRQLLREDIHTVHYPNNFIVMDGEDTSSILKIVYEQANITSRQYTHKQAKDMINYRKSMMEHIKYMLQMDSKEIKDKFLNSQKVEDKIFFGYLYQQRKTFNLDFIDLITFALYILENFEEKKKKWQQRMQYVMVDEFQDVSSSQYQIATILSNYHKNLFVVGDPDQTIYSWRGARIEFILNFDKVFSNVKTIVMNTNYRSTENILKVSNSLIDKNENRIKKELNAVKKSKIPAIYNHSKNVFDEARWISEKIKEIKSKGNGYEDICILYRAHYVSRSLEEIFMKEKIPYVIYSGVAFYERKEIKDVLSYLRMVVFEDDLSFFRTINEPKRNFGKKRMEIIQGYAEKNNCSLYNALKLNISEKLIVNSKASEFIELIERYQKIYNEMSISDLLSEILNKSGYEAMLRQSGEEDRLDNIAELKNSISLYENGAGEETNIEDYLQEIALYTNTDLKEDDDEKVKMMTIHSAKGLEFPYVFISGMNEGIFPSQKANTKEKLEEERRLAYVAYTRAENALFLSESEGFNYDGNFRYPSRFIFNINKKYLHYNVKLDKNLIDSAEDYINISESKFNMNNKVSFIVGDRISHNIFGTGKIEEVNGEDATYIVKFDKSKTSRSISFSAKLSKETNSEKNNIDLEGEKEKLKQGMEAPKTEKLKAETQAKRIEEDKLKSEVESKIIDVEKLKVEIEAKRIEEEKLK
ncbi:MAG: UvrD-helicase domain-containing protein, partial [Clostridium sp.]